MQNRTFFSGILCFFLFFCSSVPLFADNLDWLESVFWVELDPVPQNGEEYPITPRIAAKRALEEAGFVFSGMIFGFRFSYVPSDLSRNVEEEFSLDLRGQVPWGDPALVSRGVSERDNVLDFRIRYITAEHHRYRLRSWGSNIHPVSSGIGEGVAAFGYKEKVTAVREAVKAAIRTYGREATFNKPRKMTGEVLLVEPPYLILDSGAYVGRVKIKLRDVEILPYRSF